MDYNMDGFIVKSDIKKFLGINGVFQPTDLDLEGLMRKLDHSKIGRVSFSDFLEEFQSKLPQNN